MASGCLTLANIPGGFDVAVADSEQGPWRAASPPVTVTTRQWIRLSRQAQFAGSAELIYEIDGKRIPPEETGEETEQRIDHLVSSADAKFPFRLATQTRKFR